MIIKAMLKAGIMDEIATNDLGTPQGGIISPLLANAYLHSFDQWLTNNWENKHTRKDYKLTGDKFRMLKKTKLKPAYLVRYADDWVLITNSKENAERWKWKITQYLKTELKLELSSEKTLITNIRKTPIHFLGFELKVKPGKSRTGYVTVTRPDRERIKSKTKLLYDEIRKIRKMPTMEKSINQINLVNATIRGIIQYYETTTCVTAEMSKYSNSLSYTAYKSVKEMGGKWVPANQVNNLIAVHIQYTGQVPAIEYRDCTWGITRLAFCKWNKTQLKNPLETPYTAQGRELYRTRTGKKSLLARADELLSDEISWRIAKEKLGTGKLEIYNFEYYLNRAYAYNRDKGKCRVCGIELKTPWEIRTHHVSPKLPLNEVNKVQRLATVCVNCHPKIHNNDDYSYLGNKVWKKISNFRDKLNLQKV